MSTSSIEWTDATWNPVRGCRKVSPGCKNCYAETMAKRLRTGEFETDSVRLAEPLGWKKPRRVFVNSMSDLFGEGVPFEFAAAVFGVMAATPRHTYQVLTKRPARMVEFFEHTERFSLGPLAYCRMRANPYVEEAPGPWPLPNVWLGVSAEDQATADERIPLLLQVPAAVRFISAEPLLGPITLFAECMDHVPRAEGHMFAPAPGMRRRHSGWSGDVLFEAEDEVALDWVIVGGESGPRARPCELAAIRGVVTQCTEAGVACFVKQLGSRPEAYTVPVVLRDRKGGDPSEWPEDLRVRQWPRGVRA